MARVCKDRKDATGGKEGSPGLFQCKQGRFRKGGHGFVPPGKIAQVKEDGRSIPGHVLGKGIKHLLMSTWMERSQTCQPSILDPPTGNFDSPGLDVKAVDMASRADMPGKEKRIMTIAHRGIHSVSPRV
jgi:hypothetical protein